MKTNDKGFYLEFSFAWITFLVQVNQAMFGPKPECIQTQDWEKFIRRREKVKSKHYEDKYLYLYSEQTQQGLQLQAVRLSEELLRVLRGKDPLHPLLQVHWL